MLALLLTGTVTVAALIVAGLLVRELRLTDNIRKSLIAYYGAESGLESALYDYYHGGVVETQSGDVGKVASWEINSNPSQTEMAVPLPWETTKEIPLYDLDDSSSFNVAAINFSWLESVSKPIDLEWTILTLSRDGTGTWLEPGPRGSKITKDIINCQLAVADQTTIKLSDYDLAPGDQHILRFKHVNGTGSTVDFRITMTDEKGNEIAFNQQTALKVTGTAGGVGGDVSRALEVAIPLKSPAYDVFDYVIFSDTYVGKDYSTMTPFPSITPLPTPTGIRPRP